MNLFAGGTADIDDARRQAEDRAGDALSVGRRREDDRDARRRRASSRCNVRIPGWARNEPVPSDLYRFIDKARRQRDDQGQRHRRPDRRSTRATSPIDRTWKAGDVIELNLPMPVRRIVAHEKVEADRDRVALQRGPIVYAAEWADNPERQGPQHRAAGRQPR